MLLGAAVVAGALVTGPVVATPASAAPVCEPGSSTGECGHSMAGSINQVVGTVEAALVDVQAPCPAPWQQGGVAGADYDACNAAPVFQQEGPVTGVPAAAGDRGPGFAQVAAAPVHNTAPIHQTIGTVGAPLVNLNIPCPAPWQQGGVAGSNYNACNTAAVFQQEGPVLG